MLNLHDIKDRIAQPALCRIEDIAQLKELCEAFPYTQIYPILYLKALATTNDVRFEDALQAYAFRIADRQQLYTLLNEADGISEEEPEVLPEVKGDFEKVPVNESVEPHIESTPDDLLPTTITKPTENRIDQEAEIANAEDWEEGIDTGITLNISSKDRIDGSIEQDDQFISTLEENSDALLTDQSETTTDQFERELLAEVISATYTLEHLKPEASEIEEGAEEIPTFRDEENKSGTTGIEGKLSFSGWLKSNEQKSSVTIDDERAHIDEIVNRFIDNEPRISRPSNKETIERPKKAFFSPAQVAKESIDLQAMPVSETLAKIFAVQGNYPKAIFAYEQLILLNPEKKAFFASQIEELKKKITQ
jgi:tetratricopeptide (TPR) repeat protein